MFGHDDRRAELQRCRDDSRPNTHPPSASNRLGSAPERIYRSYRQHRRDDDVWRGRGAALASVTTNAATALNGGSVTTQASGLPGRGNAGREHDADIDRPANIVLENTVNGGSA